MAKELSLGVIFYGEATKALSSIKQLEVRLQKLNRGFATFEKGTRATTRAQKDSAKAIDTQRKSTKKAADEMGIYGRQIGKVSGGIQRLTAAMKVTASYGLAAAAIFGVINAFREGTKAIFDFDQALKNLQAITDATDAEISVLGDTIREVAATTKYSAKEVSDAAILVGQAGFDAAESLEAIQAVAMLATGTLTDMATTADLLTTAIRAFGLDASESGRVADIFATAVNKSKLTIDKLRTAFNYLGPVAHKAGLSLEETAAGTMVLGTAGLRGSTIGTGFRQVLARLIAPSEKLRLAFRAAGADIEKLNPLTNDFADVLDELSKVITDSGVAIRLFGMRASAASVALAEGRDVYKEMLEYTYRVGVATKMANKQMEGLAVMAKNLRDKLHELAIALGEGGIASAFRVALEILRPLVALMSEAAATTIGKFIVAVTSLTVVVTALGLAFRYLAIQLSAIVLGFTVAALKAKMLLEGVGLLTASTAALFMGVGKLFKLLWAHPFVAVTAAIAGVIVGFKTWQDSVKQQTMELHKQSIEIAASLKSLRGYQEKLEDVDEGSREHRAIIERLIEQYPQLRSEVDILTTSLHDQVEAVEKLTRVELERYLQNQARILAGTSKQLDDVTDKLDRWGQSLRENKYDIFYTVKYVEELKERQKELGEELEDQVPLWAGIIKQMEYFAQTDYSSSLSQIEEFFREFGVGLDPEVVAEMSSRLFAYFEAVAKKAEAASKKTLIDHRALMVQFEQGWVDLYDKLGQQDIVYQHKLLELFEKTLDKITKKRKELEEIYAGDPDKEKKIQAVLANIREEALKKFMQGLRKRREALDRAALQEKQIIFDIDILYLQALGKREDAEIKAIDRKATRLTAQAKGRIRDEKLLQVELLKIDEATQKKTDAVRAEYLVKRLDQEIRVKENALKLAKAGIDEQVVAEELLLKEGIRKKLELERVYWREVLFLWSVAAEGLKSAYGEDAEEFKKALNEKIEALAKFHGIQVKLLKLDEKDAKEIEKSYKVFLERVQGAFADTFYDIFEGQWEGWKDLMIKLKKLFLRTLAEMAAKAAVTKLTVNVGTSGGAKDSGAGAGASPWWGAAAVALMGISMYLEHEAVKKSRERRRQADELARQIALSETYSAIIEELDKVLSGHDDYLKMLSDIHDQFNNYKIALRELGATVGQLTEVESRRNAVLKQAIDDFRESFMAPLKDMVAELTLSEYEYEQQKLKAWYEEKVQYARYLGEETVKLLGEAYLLAEKQLWLKQQELLAGEEEKYREIVTTIGMTPLELELYYLEKTREHLDEALGGIADIVTGLNADIAGWEADIDALVANFNRASTSYTNELAAFESAEQDLLDRIWYWEEGRGRYVRVIADPLKPLKEALDKLRSDWDLRGTELQAIITSFPIEKLSLADLIAGAEAQLAELAAGGTELSQAWQDAYDAQLKNIVDRFTGDINEIIRGFTWTEKELALLALDEWYAEQLQTANALGLALDNLNRAYDLQLAAINATTDALKKSTIESWEAIIRQHTLSDYELALFDLAEWYAEQLEIAAELGLSTNLLTEAYKLQLVAIEELEAGIAGVIESIDAMIQSLTGGDLAAVQSAEFYMTKYSNLLAAAMKGTPGAVDELLAFIPDYLDFMKAFGGDYANLVSTIVAQLEKLKITLPELQAGGLTSGLTFAGEAGPEWVIPTYEPQRSRFLEDVGMDPDRIGEAIARYLVPALGDKEINLTLEIDGQPVRATIIRGLRSDTELIEAVRRVT